MINTSFRVFHLDIYRGLAIILVLLFHLNISLFKYGFLGVDIFFVLSGFLMHRYFINNFSKKKIIDFYVNRISRIYPLYFVATTATVAAIYILPILPFDQYNVIRQNFYNSILIPNIGYWELESYFGSMIFKPLLNFWTLGVEMQFYLFFPLIFFLLKKKRKYFIWISIISLITFVLLNFLSPKTSFFMFPTRFWQFCIGILSSTYFVSIQKRKKKETRLGLALFIFIFLFLIFISSKFNSFLRISEDKYYLLSILITLITFLGLTFGLPKSLKSNLFFSIISVFGKYSFSLYVWHYPIIKLFSYTALEPDNKIAPTIILYAVICILVISFISYHLIENFFRYRFKIKIFCIFLFLSIVINSVLFFGFKNIFLIFNSEKKYNITMAGLDRENYRCGAIFNLIYFYEQSCLISVENKSQYKALLYGDSQADSIKHQLKLNFNEKLFSLYLHKKNEKLNNQEKISSLIDYLKKNKFNILILHGYPGNINYKLIEEFLKDPRTKDIFLIYIGSPPVYNYNIPYSIYLQQIVKNQEIILENQESDYHSKRLYGDKNNINDIVEREFFNQLNYKNFFYVNLIYTFCSSKIAIDYKGKKICSTFSNDYKPYYFDNHHLTNTGSKLLKEDIEKILNKILATK